MRRRHLLSILGAGTLSGCIGSLESDGPGANATSTSGDSATTEATSAPDDSTAPGDSATPSDPVTLSVGETFEAEDGATVTVRGVRIRKSIVSGGVHYDPVTISGTQFVVVDLSVASPGVGTTSGSGYVRTQNLESQFRIALDGTRYSENDRVFHVVPWPDDADGVRLGFSVPAPTTAERGAVFRTAGAREVRWSLDADHLDALAHPPEFEVRRFEIPKTFERGVAFDATLTVANVGSADGTFLAELGATTISDTPEVRIPVPAGETVTAERSVEPYYPEDSGELTVVLNWGAGQLKRTAKIEG